VPAAVLNRYLWAQIEAAAMLHFCLVDQNHFSRVISSMDPGDKDNVLHRVTTEKHRRNSHRTKSIKYSQSPLSSGQVTNALSNSEVNNASNHSSSPPQASISARDDPSKSEGGVPASPTEE
jgi:hypothetical protein